MKKKLRTENALHSRPNNAFNPIDIRRNSRVDSRHTRRTKFSERRHSNDLIIFKVFFVDS